MLPHVQLSTKPKRYPTEIPTLGLKLWVSVQDYSIGNSISNGNVVKTYNNQFSLGNTVVNTGTTNVVSWNGAKAFDFRTANANYFQTSNNVGITGTAASTIILVGSPINSSGSGNGTNYHIGISWGGSSAGLSRALATDSSGSLRAIYFNDDPIIPGTTVGIGKPSVMIIRDAASSTTTVGNISQNGTTNTTVSHGAINTSDGTVRIGNWKNDLQYPFGYIAEALVYDRYLSDSEVSTLTSYFNSLYNIKGFTASSPLSSPTEAATLGLSSGTYWFKGGSMPVAKQLFFTGANYYDSSGFVRVFSSPYRSTATVNEVGSNIPFTKFMVRRVDSDTRGLVRFNTQQTYNLISGAGVIGNSAINNFGVTAVARVIIGEPGGHGIYNESQNSCSWGSTISGSIGAGYISTCGSFPNDLLHGYNTSNNGPNYSNASGTFEHLVSW